ncbi:hypothetical protein KR032_011073 [Drosophila birchii]|nr:hypothetical protein KR032_011073 [Drosophila birchii]
MQMFLWTTLISVLMIQRSAGRMLVEHCGINIDPGIVNRGDIGLRIMNGKNAERQAGAWMAAIRNNDQFQCGGTVIHKSFVLTAAHCIDDQENLFVTVGTYNKSNPVQEISVSLGVMHTEYSKENMIHDIGLLKLSRDIDFNSQVYPICISLNPLMNRNRILFEAYGWGITKTGSESELLQKVKLHRLHPSRCNRHLFTPLTSNQLCAGSSRADTCRGDSGGPLTTKFKPEEPQVQLAIVSFGKLRCDGEGIYTDISRYTDWIEHNVNLHQTRHSNHRRRKTERIPHSSVAIPRREVFLYDKCGGNDISRNLLVKIYGGSFEGKGVMITDRYVLTNAKDLPSNAASINVYLSEENFSDELEVESVIKHPDFSDDFNHDIALLKLTSSPFLSGGRKPICMLLQPRNTPIAARSPTFNTFDRKASGAIPLTARECATRIKRELEEDQLCIEEPEMTKEYDYTGDIMAKTVTYKGRNRYILFGIASYSSNGLIILTNVMRYMDWISRVIRND